MTLVGVGDSYSPAADITLTPNTRRIIGGGNSVVVIAHERPSPSDLGFALAA